MRILTPLATLALLLLASALWIGALAERLPDIAAVHFDAGGAANGFMTRDACRRFMLLSTVGVPTLIAAVTAGLPRLLPVAMLNVPHREYWMAPARARESVDFLSSRGIWFSCMLLAFLACVDWMVVKANEVRPALFPSTQFLWVLALFFCATGLWLRGMFKRFSRPPGS
jgi:hypothetical protein